LFEVQYPAPGLPIPVVQLSINADKPLDHHLQLGARLAPLRERGVLIVASGNVVHNLRGMDWKLTDDGYDWAQRFDEDAKTRMLTDRRNSRRSTPTVTSARPCRHRITSSPRCTSPVSPAGGSSDTEVLVDGYAYGSLSMTAYTVGLSCPHTAGEGGSPRPPADLPPDGSNI
jgi:4,5-DOPA dioxygenase extradiol